MNGANEEYEVEEVRSGYSGVPLRIKRAVPQRTSGVIAELNSQMADGMEFGQCQVISDDGLQCQLPDVMEGEPEHEHDFVGQPTHPVDAGQKWSSWIKAVQEVRRLLLNFTGELVTEHGTLIPFGFYEGGQHTDKIRDIAEAVGLEVENGEEFVNDAIIYDPQDSGPELRTAVRAWISEHVR